MLRETITSVALAGALLLAGCHHKVQNPMANIDSKQPDKTLYDRAMDSMKHGHNQEARSLLETLINAYPDSEYIARAKLAMGDSWYNEGGSAALKQAEVEYKDFQTFFPNMPEAAEAQMKVATIHYKEMEKPDRDYAEAARAAEEYKTLIQQYPESPLVPAAKQKLREVQEILADRQYRIAHFYYLRQNIAASQARLKSLIDSYPLYSGIDEALYELGGLYEREAAALRKQNINAAAREKLAGEYQQKAIECYSQIIKRYPAMDRVGDARHRLQALNAPVPTPTAEALAQSKAEEQSRGSISLRKKAMGNFNRHPNVAMASGVGDPSLSEEDIISAAKIVQDLNLQLLQATQSSQKLAIESAKAGSGPVPGANQPAPGSADASSTGTNGSSSTTTNGSSATSSNGTSPASDNAGNSPSSDSTQPAAAPAQINQVNSSSDNSSGTQSTTSNSSDSKQDSSSSKKKGKKGIRKLIPF
ncbi:MAG TPA: outer membrane protein assembly factor BamD [Candidatus Angelobacter sp.]|nr:outer membrane protein assembly factor BamD [Candidatus Angelobacter sp.]